MNPRPPHPSTRLPARLALLAVGTVMGLAATPAAPPADRTAYASFSVISERNIFNANRSGRRSTSRETRRPTRVDSFGLVGVLRSEQGPFAFFDGSSSEYRKALSTGGKLAGFELLEIHPNTVKLQTGTNVTELRIGMQFRREEQGEWRLSDRSEPIASPGPASSGSTPATSAPAPSASPGTSPGGGGDADEALKRLLQKREQESK